MRSVDLIFFFFLLFNICRYLAHLPNLGWLVGWFFLSLSLSQYVFLCFAFSIIFAVVFLRLFIYFDFNYFSFSLSVLFFPLPLSISLGFYSVCVSPIFLSLSTYPRFLRSLYTYPSFFSSLSLSFPLLFVSPIISDLNFPPFCQYLPNFLSLFIINHSGRNLHPLIPTPFM